jgi:UPF0148 protein
VDEEEVLKKITKLLEEGCTMLATHHDCGAPLFRCKGEVVCPVCSFETNETPSDNTTRQLNSAASEEVISRDIPSLQQEKRPNEKNFKQENLCNDESERIKNRLFESVLHRLEAFTNELEKEQDLDKLIKQLDCIEGMLRVLRFMHR